jgi:hypothetical protein
VTKVQSFFQKAKIVQTSTKAYCFKHGNGFPSSSEEERLVQEKKEGDDLQARQGDT